MWYLSNFMNILYDFLKIVHARSKLCSINLGGALDLFISLIWIIEKESTSGQLSYHLGKLPTFLEETKKKKHYNFIVENTPVCLCTYVQKII